MICNEICEILLIATLTNMRELLIN
jgi:hypothetical protein